MHCGSAGYGHDAFAVAVGGSSEAQGQTHPGVALQESLQSFGRSTGRNLNTPPGYVQALWVSHDFQALVHIFPVVQRLTHAHENHIGCFVTKTGIWIIGHVLLQHQNLFHYLASLQLAHQAASGRGAKTAGHGAPYLA